MAATTRPYLCIFNGKAHMVDAKDPGAVVRHIVGAAVTELRPARASEVAQWARENKPIETAGVAAPVVSGDAVAADQTAAPQFTVSDAWDWLDAQMGVGNGEVLTPTQDTAVRAINAAITAGQMSLMQFDEARAAIPALADAIAVKLSGGDGALDNARAMIEEQPIAFALVLEAIGDQKRRELYQDDPAGGSDKMVGDTGHLDA